MIVGLDPINEEVLNECPNIKIVAKYGVGLNNIDIELCKRENFDRLDWRCEQTFSSRDGIRLYVNVCKKFVYSFK